MNYGHAVTGAFIFFMLFILSMVFKAFTLNFDLVSENYYEKEIQFQNQINKTINTQSLSGSIQWSLENQGLEIKFPVENDVKLSGTIFLMRPSDKSKDITLPINLNNESAQIIDASKLISGKYSLQIEWELNSINYYYESTVII